MDNLTMAGYTGIIANGKGKKTWNTLGRLIITLLTRVLIIKVAQIVDN